MLDPISIETRYAKSGNLNIADQVFGEGPVNLVRILLCILNAEYMWTLPEGREFLSKLAAFSRVVVHTGECEVLGDKYSGIAVHLGARIASAAEPGQVLASSTVKDLVIGSGIRFDDLGLHTLKGVPEAWRLFRVVA